MAVTERDPPDGSAQCTSISRHPLINLLAILFMPSLRAPHHIRQAPRKYRWWKHHSRPNKQ
ncbi:unnamed protein product [Tenebrio molitor]|nr:unnamed protein product [Tenebrio molitor]